ncbi:unnamed protein product [Clavelina lepadiformis]|uniref:Fucosyltransferase n=1 Tax=Clavelina lepadiformis TaxID=159417 RepID=A0ABP0G3U0_CLALP
MYKKVSIYTSILLILGAITYVNVSYIMSLFRPLSGPKAPVHTTNPPIYNELRGELTSHSMEDRTTVMSRTSSTMETISSPVASFLDAQNVIAYKGGYAANPHLKRRLDEALSNAGTKYVILMLGWPRSKNGAMTEFECGKCEFTDDITKINDPETKAVVFYYQYLYNKSNSLPKNRRLDQYYVWSAMESPPSLRVLRNMSLTEYDNVFNLTWTYRLLDKGSGNQDEDVEKLIKMKTGVAIWIVSNCDGTKGAKKRILLAQDMVNHGLEVDRRGRCFPENSVPPRGTSTVDLIRKYKFYFAFENSYHCLDYITEKLYKNSFVAGTVPVVWGAEKRDYLAVVPPHSCIFVEDFKSTAELVKYLKYLDKNVTAYREYFKWRTMKPQDMPNYGRQAKFCQLCRILHGINVDNIFNPRYNESYLSIPLFEHPTRPRVVSSLREWLYGPVSKECLDTY